MRRGPWLIAALVLLLIALGGAWTAAQWTAEAPGDVEREPTDGAGPTAAPTQHAVRKPAAAAAADAAVAYPPGVPVNLDAVDRDRDLHGTVVRKDGTPVAVAGPSRSCASSRASRTCTSR